jgi:hypothetical protein
VWCVADNDPAGEKLRARVDETVGRVVRTVYHPRVPEPFGDLDEWRRQVGSEAFAEGLFAAIDAAAGVVP